jgi:hypothetical protein
VISMLLQLSRYCLDKRSHALCLLPKDSACLLLLGRRCGADADLYMLSMVLSPTLQAWRYIRAPLRPRYFLMLVAAVHAASLGFLLRSPDGGGRWRWRWRVARTTTDYRPTLPLGFFSYSYMNAPT